ncbi:MAG: hypothetical protein AB1426_02815 [Bacillota bacterium]
MPKALPLVLKESALNGKIGRGNIFLGGIGSGKTTIALNVALYAASSMLSMEPKKGASRERVVLVDLDIINPYFRSRIVQREMAAFGVEVVCPPAPIAPGDLPALPAAVRGALDSSACAVFDVGGDVVGATVLGCFRPYIVGKEYRLFFVVNARRPFTNTAEGIAAAVAEIEDTIRLKVDFLVNNTNIGRENGLEVTKEGLEIVRQAAALLKIPVAFTTVLEELNLYETSEIGSEVLRLKKLLHLPWE